ncbi:hypothetical protein A9Q81_08820 [Gammaproteobacteria bacterium 42_54_T18]|nr:hypothetical protein A9Q81_08820 [Gammaproteobacteria bacterium 42_54_T18]
MGNIGKYVMIAAVIAGFYFYGQSNTSDYVEDDIDLNVVLDITVDTIYSYEDTIKAQGEESVDSDAAFMGFTEDLGVNLNNALPAIYTGRIGVSPQNDASVYAFDDKNANKIADEGELGLFVIEIDGENSRVIASSQSGAVNDHHFSGTGILTGLLIGSMLNRQRGAGVNTKSLASKKPVTAKAAARARAGSGSHSKGK